MARLYVDADISRDFVQALRAAGHDVAYAVDSAPEGRSDALHLAWAAMEERILLTFNKRDYQFLHRTLTTLLVFRVSQYSHAGILTSTSQLGAKDWAAEVNRLLQVGEPLSGRMFVWSQVKQSWSEDAWRPE